MTGRNRNPIELYVGAATLLLSTAAHLLGSPELALIALIIGGISFGIVLDTNPRE